MEGKGREQQRVRPLVSIELRRGRSDPKAKMSRVLVAWL